LDGDVIDGQLNERVTMQGTNKNAHIDTITTIQVHIKLVVPTSCLKLYSFETNQDTGDILTDPFVVIPNKHDGTVNSTSPAGQCCPNV